MTQAEGGKRWREGTLSLVGGHAKYTLYMLLNPKPYTLNPKPRTLNPESHETVGSKGSCGIPRFVLGFLRGFAFSFSVPLAFGTDVKILLHLVRLSFGLPHTDPKMFLAS